MASLTEFCHLKVIKLSTFCPLPSLLQHCRTLTKRPQISCHRSNNCQQVTAVVGQAAMSLPPEAFPTWSSTAERGPPCRRKCRNGSGLCLRLQCKTSSCDDTLKRKPWYSTQARTSQVATSNSLWHLLDPMCLWDRPELWKLYFQQWREHGETSHVFASPVAQRLSFTCSAQSSKATGWPSPT
jgi:hypothetical protein